MKYIEYVDSFAFYSLSECRVLFPFAGLPQEPSGSFGATSHRKEG